MATSRSSVRGADGLANLSKALKAAGKTEVRKQLAKDLKEPVKPLIKATRAEALKQLPKAGGLAQQVAREPQRVQVRTGAKTVGVRLVVGKKRGAARSTNKGSVRHPTGGGKYVTQKVPSDWFDGPAKKALPDIRDAGLKALENVAKQIARKV